MKNYIILIILLANSAFCQTNIRVNYSFYEQYNKGVTLPAYLQVNDTYSYFEVDDKKIEHQNSTVLDEVTGATKVSTSSPKEENRFVKKDFSANAILSLENRNAGADDVVFIKEVFPNLKWILGENEKELLGYSCKNASTSFRGREYEAWYAIDIPVSDGPWKFSGLPGLILQIRDNQEKINIEAYSIEMNNEINGNISVLTPNEIAARVFNDWQSFCNYIKETLTQRSKYINSMVSQTNGISIAFVENFEIMEFIYTENLRIKSE